MQEVHVHYTIIQWREVCNNSFVAHLHRISGEKNYDEEGKENGRKVKLARFELVVVGL